MAKNVWDGNVLPETYDSGGRITRCHTDVAVLRNSINMIMAVRTPSEGLPVSLRMRGQRPEEDGRTGYPG